MRWKKLDKRLGCFINRYIEDPKHNLWDVILWRFGHYDEQHTLPPDNFCYPAQPASCDLKLPYAVWIGHSTFLIHVGHLNILTDPLFSDHCSPIPIRSLQRRQDPFIPIEKLPSIDLVLLSHNHYDHLDEKSVRRIHQMNPNALWVVPTGVRRWFVKRTIANVFELNWGQAHATEDGSRITAVPAQHFSGRGLWDENRTLWCGYVVECAGKTFYFAGDTGYNNVDFKEIGRHWASIDLSLIPIGAYAPKRLLKPIHVCPKEAVEIHCDVGSRLSLGMHWNTFSLSDEPVDLPPYDLYLAMQEKNLPFATFMPVNIGTHVNW
ncbi:MAG: napEPLD-B [Parachlamydiales bacterium]|nr:napEPLD-B [Parachlamydiales bacterium]